jgi:hypothetical protein
VRFCALAEIANAEVCGASAAFKDLRVREATPSAAWEGTRARLLEARKAAK